MNVTLRSKRVFCIILSLGFAFSMLIHTTLPASAASKKLTVKFPVKTVDIKGKIKAKANIKVTWKTSNKKIAKVSKNGVITGVKKGTAKITAISRNNKSIKKAVTIKVKNIKPKAVKLNRKTATLALGGKVTLKATLSPTGVYDKGITFKTSSKSVAQVTSKGVVTAKKTGKATISAVSKEGSKKAKCTISVVSSLSMQKDVNKMEKALDKAEDYAYKVAYKLAYDPELADDKTGFRTAGSDAEHTTSKYLAKEFKNIGLDDVERVPVTVDKWQLNDAYAKVNYKQNGQSKTLSVDNMISYASSGTVQSKRTDIDWNNIDIVDAGYGYDADYEALDKAGKDYKDKVVLVAVDQYNDTWIDCVYAEAYEKGAAAIITYQYNGYGSVADDAVNVQDLCCDDLGIPLTSISPKDAKNIKNAIKDADTDSLKVKLYVDNYVGDEDGTGYNVVGRIKGSNPDAQQILISGHYDKYFYGFQDDSTAMGLVMAVAKAMVDSGYQPYNDIVFVGHCAEEFGEFGSATDWGIGSWKLIRDAKPDWRGKTLACLNFELPAIEQKADYEIMRSTYELGTVCQNFLDSGLMNGLDQYAPEGTKVIADDDTITTDTPSYQFSGVPCVMQRRHDGGEYAEQRYHTQYDNADTYSAARMKCNVGMYAGLAMYIDGNPALDLDFTKRCDQMQEAADDSKDYIDDSTTKNYSNALAKFKTASEESLEKTKQINKDYQEAFNKGDTAKMEHLRKDGAELNTQNFKAFQKVQDTMVGLADYSDADIFHAGTKNNLKLLDDTISALSDGTVTQDDVNIPQSLWAGCEYYAYLVDGKVCDRYMDTQMNVNAPNNWGTGKMAPVLKSYLTTKKMINLFNSGKTASSDYAEVISEYKNFRDTVKGIFDGYITQEINGMNSIAEML